MTDTELDSTDTAGRHRWLAVWVVVAVVVAACSFGAGLLVRSPWDTALGNADATATATVEVEHRTFAAEPVEAAGTASVGDAREVVPTTGGSDVVVVTRELASAGDTVEPGEPLAEVSGRPLVALDLPFDLYRDLAPGDTGTDVEALQTTLKRLGVYTGRVDGNYGGKTSAAVRALYEQAGVEAPAASEEAQAAVEEAERALESAQSATAQNPAPVEGMPEDAGGADAGESQADTTDLRTALGEARFDADTPLPRAETVRIPADGALIVAVQSVGTRIGETQPSVATLRTGSASAVVRVGVADADAFVEGEVLDVVATTAQDLLRPATVVSVGDFAGADDEHDLPGYDVTLEFNDPDDVPFGDGDQVIARVPIPDSGQEGTAVPLVAVREDSVGQCVLVDGGPEGSERVDITARLIADGYVLVDDEVAVGDRLLLGGVS
ncbi:peptidoglycan-binding domain-containing protein [Paraoerskovia marina]|uniref:peptidoglycan-binding domain-containing protein n=1 Tax=Paraoerskovia marina TaxID=545619 RepID=UPI0009E04FA2|nr:peptidoglycan-binding domain-containing protein [Paraoerskovia marina]